GVASPRASFVPTNTPPTPRADCLKNSRRLIFILGLIEVFTLPGQGSFSLTYLLQNPFRGKSHFCSFQLTERGHSYPQQRPLRLVLRIFHAPWSLAADRNVRAPAAERRAFKPATCNFSLERFRSKPATRHSIILLTYIA